MRPMPRPPLTAYTLWDRLARLWDRLAELARRTRRPLTARLDLRPLEDRVVPGGGRPLPFPVIYAGAGHAPLVRAYDAETGGLNFERPEYEPSFLGGVRVAAADVDGTPDVIAAAGPGGG
jgi:hypothetical protein